MSESSTNLHEDPAVLPPQVVDRHRAIVSLMEELEATDWYDQRVQACTDPELKAILAHNRDEEKEHACMVIEWLRRNDARFAKELGEYLNTEGPIAGREAEVTTGETGETGTSSSMADSSLGIGSLRGQGEESQP